MSTVAPSLEIHIPYAIRLALFLFGVALIFWPLLEPTLDGLRRRSKMVLIIGVAAGLAVALLCAAALYLGPKPAVEKTKQSVHDVTDDIEKEFSAIAKRHGSELGELVRGPTKSAVLYQGFYEHADVIWSHETREIEVLYHDNKRVSLPERSSTRYEDEWYSDRLLREKFPETPVTLYPPFGGFAVFGKEGSPSQQKTVRDAGYRKAHFAYYGTAYFWQFQNGLVFGPIKDNPTPHGEGSQFLILLDQKPRRYAGFGTRMKPAECEPPRLRPGLEN